MRTLLVKKPPIVAGTPGEQTMQAAAVEVPEPIHGDWMVVKRKPRNIKNLNQSKQTQDTKSKQDRSNLGRKEKSQFVRDSPKVQSTSGQAKQEKGETSGDNKATKATAPHSKYKRSRKDVDTNPYQPQKNGLKEGDKPPNQKVIPLQNITNTPKIYDLGNDAKSTVAMTAVSNSRFILL